MSNERDYWPTTDWQRTTTVRQAESESLESLSESIQESCPKITSALAIRDGDLVYEFYGADCTQDSLHYVFSVTKSVLSAVVGVAIREGYIRNLDQRVSDFFPNHPDALRDKETLLVRHLITMTAGLQLESPSAPVPDRIRALYQSSEHSAGTHFLYSDPVADLLSAIITISSGRNAFQIAKPFLFDPLGIDKATWGQDEHGHCGGAAGVEWTTREMAKFGFLYLSQGRWDRHEVLSSGWVSDSTKVQSQGGPPANHPYGYMWWIGEAYGPNAYYSAGLCGQLLLVLPRLDMVIALTCNETEGGDSVAVVRRLLRILSR